MVPLALCSLSAWAEPEPQPASEPESASESPRTIELDIPEDVGGSALEGLDEDARDEASGGFPLPLQLPQVPIRGRFTARPMIQAALLTGREDRTFWGSRVGVAVSHRYWRLSDATVQWGGHTELQALFPIGGFDGRRVQLSSTFGPWIGPVGLALGAVVRSDRVQWRNADALLPDTLALGGRADLSVQLGEWRATAGFESAWLVAGNRPPADPDRATLPVVGDETAYRLGVGRQGNRIFVGLRGLWRETAIGAEVDVGLQFGLRLL